MPISSSTAKLHPHYHWPWASADRVIIWVGVGKPSELEDWSKAWEMCSWSLKSGRLRRLILSIYMVLKEMGVLWVREIRQLFLWGDFMGICHQLDYDNSTDLHSTSRNSLLHQYEGGRGGVGEPNARKRDAWHQNPALPTLECWKGQLQLWYQHSMKRVWAAVAAVKLISSFLEPLSQYPSRILWIWP